MKKMDKIKVLLLTPFLLLSFVPWATGQEDSVESKEIIKLRYFNDNNSEQYLLLEDLIKTGTKITPGAGKAFGVYLDSISETNLVAQLKTDQTGRAKTFIPVSLKTSWEQSSLHKFIAVAPGQEEGVELEITKARIQIDTLFEEGSRSATVTVEKYENGEWLPAEEVEMRIGIRRLGGGILSVNDEATFTTDSSGIVKAEFKRDSLPGDQKGDLVLIAKVDDNDLYGNLVVEKTVPWGKKIHPTESFFNTRALWSTRFKTPIWLLFMAYSVVIGVWGAIAYLIWQIVKIKKLGTAAAE